MGFPMNISRRLIRGFASASRKPKETVHALDRLRLPELKSWPKAFISRSVALRDRVSLKSPEAAAAAAEAFLPPGSRNKVVIEAFPGPGALTRALLALPKQRLRKLIVVEEHDTYLEYLRPLAEADPRVHVFPLPGYAWDTYTELEGQGALSDIPIASWDSGLHPDLHFIAHLQQNVHGEQLIAQLLRSIPAQSWLFKYGRVPMHIILSDWVWQRLTAPLLNSSRCKLTLIAEAVADCVEAVPVSSLEPYSNHFHPPPRGKSGKPDSKQPGGLFRAITFNPLAKQVIAPRLLEKWDFCLRRLFVMKATSLEAAVICLAPGAQYLLKGLTTDPDPKRRVDIKKPIKALTVGDWANIVAAFDAWPFAPEDLYISGAFARDLDRI